MTTKHSDACDAAMRTWKPKFDAVPMTGILAPLRKDPEAFEAFVDCPSSHHDVLRLFVNKLSGAFPEARPFVRG